MAHCGNHGVIVPRDKALLTRLYWGERMTLSQMGAMFNVTHRSVQRTMIVLGIPTRPRTDAKITRPCIGCGGIVEKVPHKLTKRGYGRRCKPCQRAHKQALRRVYVPPDNVRERQRRYMNEQYYVAGPLNPKGELGWIRKSQALLRRAQRLLRTNHAVCKSPRPASAPEPTSLT